MTDVVVKLGSNINPRKMCVSVPNYVLDFQLHILLSFLCLYMVFVRFVDIGVIVKHFRRGVLDTTFCDKVCQ